MTKTETTSELIQLVETSGLEKIKQNQIAETLGVFLNKAAEWDATIQSIVITSPEETGKMKMAREGRLTLKNMRLEAEKLVKAKREEVKHRMANDLLEDKLWLKAWQMIEATFKNLETKLEEKEKFAERWEAEQREKLRRERLSQLLPLGFQIETGIDLGNMDEQTFQNLKLGLETAKREREEAERRAEEERIAREKAEAEERARIEAENRRLKAEAEAKERALREAQAKAEAERKALEEKARQERLAKERLEAELRAKAEAEERARKEAEAKAAAELKAKQKAEEEAAKAPKKQRLNNWINGFVLIPPTGMNDDETVVEILEKFEAFKKWAKTKIESI
jgi:hypothetical protein